MKAIKDAVYSRLTADAAYLALVGSPASAPYRTYYLDPPVIPFDDVDAPMVVFWLRPAFYDQRLGREILSARAEMFVNTWDRREGAALQHEEVMDRIIELLHHVPDAEGFRAVLAREPQELEDHETKALGLNGVFNVFYRRSTL